MEINKENKEINNTFNELDKNFFESMQKTSTYYNKDDFYKFSNECKSEKMSYENCKKENIGYFCLRIEKMLKLCLNKIN